ncbi:class I SAM-dependent methyltransferase [Nonomuraea turcica]|uniref:class I SAM-dependent methyltransferase n=1 Tax=Nonomuraea sp. G32 TaxID=3067274 RepID=UPI00273A934B|nr:class I SAM-dependent methyltransferase [Nonomuraea sp. G32]MDP4500505.1 class I SAM-dependent methyltransferase [Nonomuraea sp. G32]
MRFDDEHVMFFAEQELMARHAAALIPAPGAGDVLEIGFGLGVCALEINLRAPRTYLCVELHPVVARMAGHILRAFGHPCEVIQGPWQTSLPARRTFDAVMVDSFPPPGWADEDFLVFVEQAVPEILRPGGRFSFFCCGDELNPVRRAALDRTFSQVSVSPHTIGGTMPTAWSLPSNQFLVHACLR